MMNVCVSRRDNVYASRRDFNNDALTLCSWDHYTNQNPHKILIL